MFIYSLSHSTLSAASRGISTILCYLRDMARVRQIYGTGRKLKKVLAKGQKEIVGVKRAGSRGALSTWGMKRLWGT